MSKNQSLNKKLIRKYQDYNDNELSNIVNNGVLEHLVYEKSCKIVREILASKGFIQTIKFDSDRLKYVKLLKIAKLRNIAIFVSLDNIIVTNDDVIKRLEELCHLYLNFIDKYCYIFPSMKEVDENHLITYNYFQKIINDINANGYVNLINTDKKVLKR